MEITDARQIEIFHTLEKIERMNKAVAFHKALDNPDKLAIEQATRGIARRNGFGTEISGGITP
jgi:hypothetical protein